MVSFQGVTSVEEDLLITAAGPVATALFRGQLRSEILRGQGFGFYGGTIDAIRFCMTAAHLYGGVPELCSDDDEIRPEDGDFVNYRAEKERNARARVLEVLTDDSWVRLTAAAYELLKEGTLDEAGFRVL